MAPCETVHKGEQKLLKMTDKFPREGFLNSQHRIVSCTRRVATMRIVLRIGGSVVASPAKPSLLNDYAGMMKTLRAKGHQIAVVVGGGELARELINVAKEMGLPEEFQDEVAISASRIYAQLLVRRIGNAGCNDVSMNVEQAVKCVGKGKIAIMGGLRPGMTTDAVAALVGQALEADLLVKATDQEGIFDKDPKKYADAVKLDHVRLKDLRQVCMEDKHKAGIHQVIDPEAVRILQRARVKVVVVNGYKPENVLAAVAGKRVGTVVD
jgi:uridylate kinase